MVLKEIKNNPFGAHICFLALSYLKAVLPALTPPATAGRKRPRDCHRTELGRVGAALLVSGELDHMLPPKLWRLLPGIFHFFPAPHTCASDRSQNVALHG